MFFFFQFLINIAVDHAETVFLNLKALKKA